MRKVVHFKARFSHDVAHLKVAITTAADGKI